MHNSFIRLPQREPHPSVFSISSHPARPLHRRSKECAMSLNPMGFGDPAITKPPWIADPSLMGLGASQHSGPRGPALGMHDMKI